MLATNALMHPTRRDLKLDSLTEFARMACLATESRDKNCEDELISVISRGIFLFQRLQSKKSLWVVVFNGASLGSDLGRCSSSLTEAE